MTQTEDRLSEEKRPAALARAICTLPTGESRTLYVRSFSLAEAFVMTLRPPPIGTEIGLTLCPKGVNPLPPLAARVIATRLDPRSAADCGFCAVWTALDEVMFQVLLRALEAFGLCHGPLVAAPRYERRLQPRIQIDHEGALALPTGRKHVLIANLSMSGALLVSHEGPFPAIGPNSTFELLVPLPGSPERLSLTVQVVRCEAFAGSWRMGVRFLQLSEAGAARLEELVLRHLTGVSDITDLPDRSAAR